jgi:hypothetical protein
VRATAWVRRLRDRPIAERERRTTLTLVVVLLAASVVLLAATRPARRPDHHASRRPGVPVRSTPRPAPTSGAANAAPVAPAAARVAQRFLARYLAYMYGHAPIAAVRDATPVLLRSLRAHPPLVPLAMRARSPRVLSLRPAPAPLGLVGVGALINDGELASYRVVVLLAPERGRLLVSTVEGT